jgi:hypothetical protein
LAGVNFKLNIVPGKNTWYSNEFNTQYLELKIDPTSAIHLDGKDKDRTPDAAGIKCKGFATSSYGTLRYLSHEFKLQEGSISLSYGAKPLITGTATDRLKDANVATAGGPRQMDVDVALYFKGNFGSIDFKLTSSPAFSTDPDSSQKILYSYIMFGQDMTGLSTGNPTNYSQDQLQALYQQKVGTAFAQAADDLFSRYFSNSATKILRGLAPNIGEVNFKAKLNIIGTSPISTPGIGAPQEAPGNTLTGVTSEIVQLDWRRYLDNRLSLTGSVGLNSNSATGQPGLQGNLGLGYDIGNNLNLDLSAGQNENAQTEERVTIQKRWELPNIANPNVESNDKPQFLKYDAYTLIPGKVKITWSIDKYTKCQISLLDDDGKVVQTKTDDFAYDHSVVFDGLNPQTSYKVDIVASDSKQNKQETQRILPASGQ